MNDRGLFGDEAAGDKLFTFVADLPPDCVDPGSYLLEIMAWDESGQESALFLYFEVGADATATPTTATTATPAPSPSGEPTTKPTVTPTPAPGALQAAARASPATGPAPLAVEFSAEVAGGRPPYTYAWDFGDGTGATSPAPSHLYSCASVHPVAVELEVRDTGGGLASSTVEVHPQATSGLVSGFEAWCDGTYLHCRVRFAGDTHGGDVVRWEFTNQGGSMCAQEFTLAGDVPEISTVVGPSACPCATGQSGLLRFLFNGQCEFFYWYGPW